MRREGIEEMEGMEGMEGRDGGEGWKEKGREEGEERGRGGITCCLLCETVTLGGKRREGACV